MTVADGVQTQFECKRKPKQIVKHDVTDEPYIFQKFTYKAIGI